MINVAIRCARSLHSRLAQTTPPWERTYFNVRRRHRGQRNQLPSQIQKLWGERSRSDFISGSNCGQISQESSEQTADSCVEVVGEAYKPGEPDVMVSALDVAQVAERHAAQYGELRLREPFLFPELSDSPSYFSLNCSRRMGLDTHWTGTIPASRSDRFLRAGATISPAARPSVLPPSPACQGVSLGSGVHNISADEAAP